MMMTIHFCRIIFSLELKIFFGLECSGLGFFFLFLIIIFFIIIFFFFFFSVYFSFYFSSVGASGDLIMDIICGCGGIIIGVDCNCKEVGCHGSGCRLSLRRRVILFSFLLAESFFVNVLVQWHM